MILSMLRVLAIVSAICAATWSEAALAQAFPSRPVRLIVPFPPGGTTDAMTRVIAPQLSEFLGQQVIVDNRPGAGGTLGTEIAAKSPADGHSIMLGTISTLAIAPNFYPNLGYDPVKSFAPISLIARLPFFILVNASVPANSLQDLISLARSKPGLLNFASPGNGTLHQVAGETFNKMASVDLVHVPYKGDAPAITDLISGRVQVMFDALGPHLPYIKSGKLKVLAAASPKRHPLLPDVPTAAEAGLPGYEVVAWFGFLAPKATPPEIIGRLNADVLRALRKPEVREALSMRGLDASGSSSDEFSALIRDEVAKWSRVVRDTGLRPD
jgi:tripartite-type tricarboxylate transporter receptor subunit TctC